MIFPAVPPFYYSPNSPLVHQPDVEVLEVKQGIHGYCGVCKEEVDALVSVIVRGALLKYMTCVACFVHRLEVKSGPKKTVVDGVSGELIVVVLTQAQKALTSPMSSAEIEQIVEELGRLIFVMKV